MAFSPPILLRKDDFSSEEYEDICEFIQEKVDHLDRRLGTFRTETLPEYLRLYKGRPKDEVVDWPWEGASNLQIPLIGTYTDELLSRTMGGIWMYDPLWTAVLSGDTPDKDGEEMKELYQQSPKPPKMLLISFPHNPTTTCVDLAFLTEIVELARKHGTLIVHDFAYADLGFDGYTPPSILQVPGAKEVAPHGPGQHGDCERFVFGSLHRRANH